MEKSIHAGAVSPRARRAMRAHGAKGERVRGGRAAGQKTSDSRTVRAENARLYTLLEFSTLLSSTRGVDQLLKVLAVRTSELLDAGRTSIFVYDEPRGELWSKVAEGTGRKTIRVPADKGIVGLVLHKDKLLNIQDAYRNPHFNRDVDKATGFHTRNILAAPMRSQTGGVAGVLEVLNKKSGVFTAQDGKMLMSIASIAAVALENSLLIEGQVNLFESFIESSIHALGERDRITYGHTVRVALYADRIARAVSAADRSPFKPVHYSEDALRKLRFAALLHDIGKITVPEAILNKKDKLNPHDVEGILTRFEKIKMSEKIRAMENGGLDRSRHELFCKGLDADFELIRRNLVPGAVTPEEKREFDRMRGATFKIGDEAVAQLSETEYEHLVLAKGNLSPAEFTVMQDHVKKTWDILGKIDWPKDLKDIPLWAASHHERPNGTGYPMGLKGDEIPLEGQILAVADIFDALTAADRPYKKRIPIEEAKDIIRQMALAGHVNKDIVDLFLEQPDEMFAPPSSISAPDRARGEAR